MRLIFVLCVFVLGGCATTYCHPTKTAADFERDKYDCEGVGVQRTHQWGLSGNPLIIADEMKRCLEIKHGWQRCSN